MWGGLRFLQPPGRYSRRLRFQKQSCEGKNLIARQTGCNSSASTDNVRADVPLYATTLVDTHTCTSLPRLTSPGPEASTRRCAVAAFAPVSSHPLGMTTRGPSNVGVHLPRFAILPSPRPTESHLWPLFFQAVTTSRSADPRGIVLLNSPSNPFSSVSV